MRAEMTVGLDLKKLEDLRIFNGYETLSLERGLSAEPCSSSPEQADNGEDSDNFQQPGSGTKRTKAKSCESKQKCGRPSNPVPRHKRESHIKAEYKRRDKIQKGFDSLMSMVPALAESSASKESKSSMLFKTAEYCRRLKSESGDVESETRALRRELESLGTEIQFISSDLQDKLPKQGASVVDKETLQMDGLYNAFVEEETKKNWKFWIFGFFMKPLYKSYRAAVTGTHNSLEFSKVVIDWAKDAMSLSSLRQGFLDSLRKVSTQTDIMYHPELLEKEAASKSDMHCVATEPAEEVHTQDVYMVTPTAINDTPIKTTPKTTPRHTPKVTPVPTPTPTPPRTPTSARRNKRRDTHISKESRPNSPEEVVTRVTKKSRSRSNSPQDGSARIRRRPSNRSEKRHHSGDVEDLSPMTFSSTMSQFTFTQHNGTPFKIVSSVSSLPIEKSVHQLDDKRYNMNTAYSNKAKLSEADAIVSSSLVSHENVPFSTVPKLSQPDEKLLTTFIGSLASFLETSQQSGPKINRREISDRSSTVVTCSQSSMSVDNPPVSSEANMEASQECVPSVSQSSFIPIDHAGVITNNSIIAIDQSVPDPLGESMLSDVTPVSCDFYPSSQNDSLSVLHSSRVTTSICPVTSLSLYTHNPSLNTFIEASDPVQKAEAENVFTNDEDSLMKTLSLDVLDVNSVMTFFGDEQP